MSDNVHKSKVSVDDIPKFERLNALSISVWLYYTARRDIDTIYLLLIEGEDKFHYALIIMIMIECSSSSSIYFLQY